MRQKSMSTKSPAEKAVRDIRRKTRKQYSAEEKIRSSLMVCVARTASRRFAAFILGTIVLLIHRLSREKKIAPEVPETSVQRPDAYKTGGETVPC
jgi:hypothetical protein